MPYTIEECDTSKDENRLWHVIDEKGNEICSPKESPNLCEDWINEYEILAIAEASAALELWGPWVRLSEAARETGIAFSSIAQAAREGRLPHLQIGRQKFVRLSAVRAACSSTRGRRKAKTP